MKPETRQAKVDEIIVKSKVKAKKETTIELKGKLGDTGWQFSEEQINIDKNLNRVGIILIINKKRNIVGLDVITDYSKEVVVVFPHKGMWKVKCNNTEIDVDVL
ncbi:MAG: hypothetical protein KGD64_02720 [Candidatus Heimdallarchaeota archaeon]|nr:hypothetical protein [Candidatus Heimdallarchaeota archaeon]